MQRWVNCWSGSHNMTGTTLDLGVSKMACCAYNGFCNWMFAVAKISFWRWAVTTYMIIHLLLVVDLSAKMFVIILLSVPDKMAVYVVMAAFWCDVDGAVSSWPVGAAVYKDLVQITSTGQRRWSYGSENLRFEPTIQCVCLSDIYGIQVFRIAITWRVFSPPLGPLVFLLPASVHYPFISTVVQSPLCASRKYRAWCASSLIVASQISTHQRRIVLQMLRSIASMRKPRSICSIYTQSNRGVAFQNFQWKSRSFNDKYLKLLFSSFALKAIASLAKCLNSANHHPKVRRDGTFVLVRAVEWQGLSRVNSLKGGTGLKVLIEPDCGTIVSLRESHSRLSWVTIFKCKLNTLR